VTSNDEEEDRGSDDKYMTSEWGRRQGSTCFRRPSTVTLQSVVPCQQKEINLHLILTLVINCYNWSTNSSRTGEI